MTKTREREIPVRPLERLKVKTFLFLIGLYRRMTIGVRVIMVDGDRVFLVRHTYIGGWHFPGGGIEPGETAVQSAAREVLEETGYRLTVTPRLHGVFLNQIASDRDHVIAYVARDFEKLRDRRPDHEIAESGWFEWTNPPEQTTTGTRQRLEEIFSGAEPGGHW